VGDVVVDQRIEALIEGEALLGIDGGVSLDLATLNTAELAEDRSYVSIGSGVTWGEAYDKFSPMNIGFTGGICEDVGAGGVAIGGGQSLFQPKRGWAVDNILNYEVVLASGDLVNANGTSNPDLFKALKGGNTNFGVVTRVDIEAFEWDGLWAGEIFTAIEGPFGIDIFHSRDEILDGMSHALTDFTAGNDKDRDSAVQVMVVYMSHHKGQYIDSAISNTANKANPELLQPFQDLPNQVPIKTYTEHTKLNTYVHKISEFQTPGYRQVTAQITYFNDYTTTRELWDAADKIYESLPFKDEVDWMFSYMPQPKSMQTFAEASGGNSLGLQDVHEDQMVLWLTSRWEDEQYDEQMYAARDQWVKDTEAVAKKHGTYHPFLYINYAAPTQQPLCGYGNASMSHLQATAKKYDPDQVFQKLMPGGFKLSKAQC